MGQIFKLKKNYNSTRKNHDNLKNNLSIEKVFLRKALKPLALEEKINQFHSTHMHTNSPYHQQQRGQTGKNNCDSHHRQRANFLDM